MKTSLVYSFILCLCYLKNSAQEIPFNTCGIVNTYDASGNRLKRVYFCNNGIDPYPMRKMSETVTATEEFQAVDALYPNPTSGKFLVTFSKALNNASILLTDANGKAILQFKASGNKIDFDLTSVPPGVYFVAIHDAGTIITKKVIKQ